MRAAGAPVWIGIGLALAGLVMLSGIEAGSTGGDLLVLAGAACYALQIVLMERYAPRFDPLSFTLVEMVVAFLAFGAIAVALGDVETPHGWTVRGALLVTGVFASALAFLVQTGRSGGRARPGRRWSSRSSRSGPRSSATRSPATGSERSAGAAARRSWPGSSSRSRRRQRCSRESGVAHAALLIGEPQRIAGVPRRVAFWLAS